MSRFGNTHVALVATGLIDGVASITDAHERASKASLARTMAYSGFLTSDSFRWGVLWISAHVPATCWGVHVGHACETHNATVQGYAVVMHADDAQGR